jgi:hypothetical protein
MIEQLTPKQVESMDIFRNQWLKIGLDTARLDVIKTIAAMNLSYAKGGLKEPRFFLFPDGPMEAMRFLAVAKHCQLTEQDFVALAKQSPLALTEAIRTIAAMNPDVKLEFVEPAFCGQHEAGWLSFQDFFATHFGLSELSEGLRELVKHSGWVWAYTDLAIVCQKPVHVSMLNGRLHNEKRAAIEYADGTCVYAVNGVQIPKKWVVERETMDSAEIFACKDTDVRAAGLALYGYSRLKSKLNYKVLEGDPRTDIGALVQISIPGLEKPGRFLEAVCPRNGPVWLGIPENNPWDQNRKIQTAVGAQAFLARLPESAYQHPPIRT